jgi:hypothetical protein
MMESLVPDQSQLTFYPEFEIFRDAQGNAYEYGPGGNLRPVETTNASDPYDIKKGGYAGVLEEAAPGIVQKIQQTQAPGESWIDTLQKLVPALTMTVQQVQLMQLNIERAKNGLPPIDIAQYSGIGVNVGLSASTKNLLIYGGIALMAVFLLTRGK